MSIALCNIVGSDELCSESVAGVQIPVGPGLVRVYIFEIENGSVLEASQGCQFILLVIVHHQLSSHPRSEGGGRKMNPLHYKYLTAQMFPRNLL
jgi:hypothetical protein